MIATISKLKKVHADLLRPHKQVFESKNLCAGIFMCKHIQKCRLFIYKEKKTLSIL